MVGSVQTHEHDKYHGIFFLCRQINLPCVKSRGGDSFHQENNQADALPEVPACGRHGLCITGNNCVCHPPSTTTATTIDLLASIQATAPPPPSLFLSPSTEINKEDKAPPLLIFVVVPLPGQWQQRGAGGGQEVVAHMDGR